MSEPPENAKGATPRSRARCKTLAREFDHAGSVKAADLEQLARAYAKAADAEHAAKLARIMARDRLIERAPIGFESESVRVIKRNCWKLNDEAVAEMTATRAALIEDGKADLVATVIAVRIGREDQSWQS